MADTSRTAAAEEDALESREPAGYRHSDASVKERILRQLALEKGLDASSIMVELQDCEVTLNGSVRCYADMQRAEALACAIEGVKLVRNGLTSVEPPPQGHAERRRSARDRRRWRGTRAVDICRYPPRRQSAGNLAPVLHLRAAAGAAGNS